MSLSPTQPNAAVMAQSKWYVIQTLPRHEKSVNNQLQMGGVRTVLPVAREVHKWSDRRQEVSVPLFPCYLFAQMSDPDSERIRLLRTSGVVGFVGPRRQACPVPTHQVENIRCLMELSPGYRAHPYVNIGQRVRVRDGALKGIEGVLLKIGDDQSLILSVDLIYKSVAVRIEGYAVEPI